MDSRKTFKFMLKSVKLTSTKDYALLRKKHIKVKSLVVPLKGSSSFSEYLVTEVLKYNKPPQGIFKTLCKVKTYNIAHEFLQFFARNKQVLKGIQIFKGKFIDLSHHSAKNLSKLLNTMKDLKEIDDLSKFFVKRKVPSKGYRFTFPGKKLGGLKSVGSASPLKELTNESLRCIHPLKKVKSAEFTPHVDFGRLFPSLYKLKMNVSFLKRLTEIKGRAIQELIIEADENTEEGFSVQNAPNFCETLLGFHSLKNLMIVVTEEEHLEVVELIMGLEEMKLLIHCYLEFSLDAENLELVQKIRKNFEKTSARVFFHIKDLTPKCFSEGILEEMKTTSTVKFSNKSKVSLENTCIS